MKFNNIPENSGVYLMKNKNKKVIYVGKAKNLKKRVSSYFIGAHNKKTMELVKNIDDIEFFLCNNELEAFILENNLIKKYKPKYNILLKDQKTYPYIKISNNYLPKLSIVRKVEEDGAKYYGPYPNINLKNLYKNLVNIFNISDCAYPISSKPRRACLKYYMKLCNGICFDKSEKTKLYYKKSYENLIKFLDNKDKKILKSLNKKMIEFSKNQEFEKAIKEKEKIKILEKLMETQIIEITRKFDEDIFYIIKEDNKLYIETLIVREGKMIDKNINIFNGYIEDDNIENIIYMYYENKNVPNKIILQEQFLEKIGILKNWFNLEKKKNPKIVIPKIKSRNKELLDLAKTNLIIEKEKVKNKGLLQN